MTPGSLHSFQELRRFLNALQYKVERLDQRLKGGFPLPRIRPRDQAIGYQSMRSSNSKLKASVYWRTRGQFWKLNQVQLFCNHNERKPIRLLLFNARACGRTGSRDQIRWSGSRPWRTCPRTVQRKKIRTQPDFSGVSP